MRKIKSAAIVAALFSIFGVAQAGGNLISNGGFESGSFGAGTTSFDPEYGLQVGGGFSQAALTGWQVVDATNGVVWYENSPVLSTVYPLLAASEGSHFLNLVGSWTTYSIVNPPIGVQQAVVTEVGKTYRVSFDMGNHYEFNGGELNKVGVSAAGSSTTFTSSSNVGSQWDRRSFDFVATGSSTTISFTAAGNGTYFGLDNVVVAAIPEPETYAMLLAGLGLMGVVARRRKQK